MNESSQNSIMIMLTGNQDFIRSELHAFTEFLTISEELLPTAQTLRHFKSVEQLEALGLDEESSEGEFYLAREEAIEVAERIYPRYFRGAGVVALYALLESSIDRMAKDFAEKLQVTGLNLSGNINDRKRSFEETMRQPIYSGADTELWNRLEVLMTLRHVLAHDGGRYENSSRHRGTLEGWAASGRLVGVELLPAEDHGSPTQMEGYISFSKDYLWSALDDVKVLLEDLISRWQTLPSAEE